MSRKKPDPPKQKLIVTDVSSEAIHLLNCMARYDFEYEPGIELDEHLERNFNKLAIADQRQKAGVLIERLIREEYIRTRSERTYKSALNDYRLDQNMLAFRLPVSEPE